MVVRLVVEVDIDGLDGLGEVGKGESGVRAQVQPPKDTQQSLLGRLDDPVRTSHHLHELLDCGPVEIVVPLDVHDLESQESAEPLRMLQLLLQPRRLNMVIQFPIYFSILLHF